MKKPMRRTKKRVGRGALTTFKSRRIATISEVFPDRYMVACQTNFSGRFNPAGNRKALITMLFANSLYLPFEAVGSFSLCAINNNFATSARSSGTGSPAGYQPTGYTQLSSIYSTYRVISSAIRVTVSPTNDLDSLTLVVFPIAYNTAVNIGISGTVGSEVPYCDSARGMKFAKDKQCTLQNGSTRNTIKSYMSTGTINGYTKSQYSNHIQAGVPIASKPNITTGTQSEDLPWLWVIGIYANDDTKFANQLDVNIELKQYTMFTNAPQSNQLG